MDWFVSDEHLQHKRIIELGNRPFSSLEEMEEIIIQNHNKLVKYNDNVYHLGDFSFCDSEPILNRMNGNHFLIKGNHDHRHKNRGFSWVKDTYFLKKDVGIFMSHFSHRTWHKAHYGTIHLYGHSHGRLEGLGRSMDVGVDCNNFTPVAFDDIIERMKKIEIERVDR